VTCHHPFGVVTGSSALELDGPQVGPRSTSLGGTRPALCVAQPAKGDKVPNARYAASRVTEIALQDAASRLHGCCAAQGMQHILSSSGQLRPDRQGGRGGQFWRSTPTRGFE
jgi:hypothetical protein